MPYYYLGDWVLGNFSTVDEVRAALAEVFVFEQVIPQLNSNIVFPIHTAIYDASGKGIVVEYMNGKINIYENSVGILTNSPNYDWHVTNLRNYS